MTKTDIKSYADLLAEKQRLKAVFMDQKQLMKDNVTVIKDSLNPIKAVAKEIGKLTSPDKSLGLLNAGLGFGLDLVLRKFLLKKSGWMVRLTAPFIIKNVVSHFAAKKIRTDMPELKNIIEKMPKTV